MYETKGSRDILLDNQKKGEICEEWVEIMKKDDRIFYYVTFFYIF